MAARIDSNSQTETLTTMEIKAPAERLTAPSEVEAVCSKAALVGLAKKPKSFPDEGEKFLQGYQIFCYGQKSPSIKERKVLLATIAKASACRMTFDPDKQLNCGELGCISRSLYCTDAQDPEPDAILIKEWMVDRPYLFIEGNNCIFLIKNKNIKIKTPQDIQLQLFNTGTGNYEDISEEDLKALMEADGVNKQSRHLAVIFDLPLVEELPQYVSEETPFKETPAGLFYHEKQTESYCTLHAANSFCGRSVVKPKAIADYLSAYFSQAEMFDRHIENEQGAQSAGKLSSAAVLSLERVDGGIDPGIVVKYLATLSSQKVIDSKFQHTKLFNMKLENDLILISGDDHCWIPIDASFFEKKDRLILGTLFPAHTVAFRKKTEGDWVKIDSHYSKQTVVGKSIEAHLKQVLHKQIEAGCPIIKLACLHEI